MTREVLMLALVFSTFILAISAPPAQIIAVLLFILGACLHGFDRSKWGNVAVAAGLAVAFWPW